MTDKPNRWGKLYRALVVTGAMSMTCGHVPEVRRPPEPTPVPAPTPEADAQTDAAEAGPRMCWGGPCKF